MISVETQSNTTVITASEALDYHLPGAWDQAVHMFCENGVRRQSIDLQRELADLALSEDTN